MTIPPCIEIPSQEPAQSAVLPGGATLEHLNLLEALQPALAPLMPVFNIIDAVVAVFDCIEAIPDTLGPPPNPAALAACIPELAVRVDGLLALIPQLSLPLTLLGALDALIAELEQAVRRIRHLQNHVGQLARVADRARELGDGNLLDLLACAEQNAEQEAVNTLAGLEALGGLVGVCNVFLGMVGLSEIPSFDGLAGRPLNELAEAIEAPLDAIKAVREAIPIG